MVCGVPIEDLWEMSGRGEAKFEETYTICIEVSGGYRL